MQFFQKTTQGLISFSLKTNRYEKEFFIDNYNDNACADFICTNCGL
jgi:hypothetical protein